MRHWLRPVGCPPWVERAGPGDPGPAKEREEINSGLEKEPSMLPELASLCACLCPELPEEAAKAPFPGDSFRTQAQWTHARKYSLLKVLSQLLSPS